MAMTNAGFVMVEDTYDDVRCPGCPLKLQDWDIDNDPLAEHLELEADCEIAKAMKKYAEKRQETLPTKRNLEMPIRRVAANEPSSPATSATSTSAAAVPTPTSSTIAPPPSSTSSAPREYRLLHFTKGPKRGDKWHLARPTSKGMPLDAKRADLSTANNPFRMLDQGFHTGVLEAVTEVVGEGGGMYG
ncbi:MAG: hypothetical protein Q9183_000700, partial [Haloplaca sp. 2 TL-2023]